MNVAITNRKILSTKPEWAVFRGFSLLFDNPGSSLLTSQNRLKKIDCKVGEDHEFVLYKALSTAVNLVGNKNLKEQYLFCPLPDFSYHVTTWDGLNEWNCALLSSLDCSAYTKYLANLPHFLLTNNRFTELAALSSMVKKRLSLKLRFCHLEIIQNDGLVACLSPVDTSSEAELKQIVELRSDLYEDYKRGFGINLSYMYKPHITLGYFAKSEYAEMANQELDAWNEITARTTDGLIISFKSISLYGFRDMVSFYKRREIARDYD